MKSKHDIRLKRVYEPPTQEDGHRVLVDRVWPRGIKKSDASLILWLKEAAPSTVLRKWFGHEPARWLEFQRRYHAELDENPQVLDPLLEVAKKGRVTLVYGAHDTEHNNAVALKSYLEKI